MTADSPIVHAKTQRAFVETRNAGRDIGARAEDRRADDGDADVGGANVPPRR